MNRKILLALLGGFALLAAAGTAAAQGDGALEMGVDTGLVITSPDEGDNVTAIQIPISNFRIGIWVGPKLAIETNFMFQYLDSGDYSMTEFSIEPDLALHLAEPDAGMIPFIQAGPRYTIMNLDTGIDDFDANQFALSFGGGIKSEIAPQLRMRIHAGVTLNFENEDDGLMSSTDIFVKFGFSFFKQ